MVGKKSNEIYVWRQSQNGINRVHKGLYARDLTDHF